MTVDRLLTGIMAWRVAHGELPAKAFVSAETATAMLRGVATMYEAPLKFGTNTLGVTEWYIDPAMSGDGMRFEAGNAVR